ncbi:MAG: YbhB/YbcL family Raf kinase inhibitor-like protein [Gemmatimonadaceae bacterium]
MAQGAAGIVPMSIAPVSIAPVLVRFLSAVAMCLSLAQVCEAQNPPGGGRGRGGRGGGRGRGIQVMTLTSSAFDDGAAIPIKYTQPGGDVSPPLTWSGAPDSSASFVLIVHDVDAATEGRGGAGFDDLLQWMVWNIPGSAKSLPQSVAQGPQLPDGSRQISVTGPYYRGPAAPATGPVHHYLFELYALDVLIDVPAVGAAPAATRAAVIAAMLGHVRGKAVLVGTFRRAAP